MPESASSHREPGSASLHGGRPPRLVVEGLWKQYWVEREAAGVPALCDVSISIAEGEFLAIVGPSGCGKTTMLNVIAGLLPFEAGTMTIDGRPVSGPGPERAVVFQHASLLPWRTVLGNVQYGMEMQRRFDKATMRARAQEFIDLVGLRGFESRYPSELSGGMQQRVNLARALATDPVLLLMDEPFAALDAQTREFMQAELLKLWSTARKTVLFVTHQINEAIFLADRVIVLSDRPGRVKAIVPVPFERPRALSLKRDLSFLEIEDGIWRLIEEEAERASLDGSEE